MDDSILKSLVPEIIWQRFDELKNTPRPSKQEQQVMEYLRNWATQRGFTFSSDPIGNLCVQVPASPGCERASTVTLQNHVDIVVANAEAPSDSADSARGVIPVERGDFDHLRNFTPNAGGDWIRAPRTTLGADNGIGCAFAMAVAEMPEVKHPQLELLFTVDEEEGMSGALQLDADRLQLKGRTMVNLDTEEDDELTIGSAGGCNSHLQWRGELTPIQKLTTRKIVLDGLKGGHSGTEINSGRANAIRLMAMALNIAKAKLPLRVVSIEGGDRSNAIPRSCSVTIGISVDQIPSLQESLKETSSLFNQQFAGRDHAVHFAISETQQVAEAFTEDATQELLGLLLTIPTGVFAMTPEIPHLPETSNNLAIVNTTSDTVKIDCSSRSSYEPGIRDVLASIQAAARLCGAEVRLGNQYPGWKPNLGSKVLAATRDVYEKLFKEKPKVLAVHAGLECGVLTSKIAGLDCISFGPTIRGNHAPGEHVSISSVQKSFRLLIGLLESLAST